MKIENLRKDAVVTANRVEKVANITPEELKKVVGSGFSIYVFHAEK